VHAAVGDPLRHLPLGAREVLGQVVDEEPLHPRALLADHVPVAQPVRLPGRLQVLGDAAAAHHAPVAVQRAECVVEDLPADVVEEHVHAVGAQLADLRRHVVGAVVDRGVVAELLGEHPALRGRAGDADHAAAEVARDPADVRTDAARGARHEHRLALRRLADVHETEV